jgi:hypothetical protein
MVIGLMRFMTIDEFLAIFTELNLINQVLTERDVLVAYNQAMMSQVDEINFERHMKMQMLEFLEAIARCADILSLPPPGSVEEEWPIEKKAAQLLVKKVEHLLYILIKLCKKEFINKYVWPGRDMWGLFALQKGGGNMDK